MDSGPDGYAEVGRVTEGMAAPSLVPRLAIDVGALLGEPQHCLAGR